MANWGGWEPCGYIADEVKDFEWERRWTQEELDNLSRKKARQSGVAYDPGYTVTWMARNAGTPAYAREPIRFEDGRMEKGDNVGEMGYKFRVPAGEIGLVGIGMLLQDAEAQLRRNEEFREYAPEPDTCDLRFKMYIEDESGGKRNWTAGEIVRPSDLILWITAVFEV